VDIWTLDGWHWLLIGTALLALELLTPGALVLMFFGVGALGVGLLWFAGLAGPLWWQITLFTALSLASLLSLRPLLRSRLHLTRRGTVDSLVGETALALDGLAVGGVGKAELRGSTWSARNVGTKPLSLGQRCSVVRVEGLTLWLRDNTAEEETK
jgi:inner membrane protein